MNKNFVKGTSENLPKVDLEMLLSYILENESFYSAEMRGIKALRSMRQNYGDNAIGYVQLLRQGDSYIVEAKVSPEHKIRNKNYTVKIIVNEKEESIIQAECQDCAAALGGCKHAVAFIAWLYRKSEEPSPTSVTCYWKKPLLSNVGTTMKYTKIIEIARKSKYKSIQDKQQQNENENEDDNLLNLILKNKNLNSVNSHLNTFFYQSDLKKLSIHYCAVTYSDDKSDPKLFNQFCAKMLSIDRCKSACQMTVNQNENNLWYELRYGRITASTIYEVAQCTTLDGSLVEKIMCIKNIDTLSMKRGRTLEAQVLKAFEVHLKQTNCAQQVSKCGLLLNEDFPMLGASPDGITENAVIEIKCPAKEKSVSRYYKDGKIQPKYKAQLHLQMLFAQKSDGYFCVADHNFEDTKKIALIHEKLDYKFISAVIKRAMKFWETAIFPHLMVH